MARCSSFIDCSIQYNPTELSFDKQAQIAEITIPGLDAPIQQFVRGKAEKLTVEMFFDTTDEGMGVGARSVTEETDKIYQLVKIIPRRARAAGGHVLLERQVSRRRSRREVGQSAAHQLYRRRREREAEVHAVQPRGRAAARDGDARAARVPHRSTSSSISST